MNTNTEKTSVNGLKEFCSKPEKTKEANNCQLFHRFPGCNYFPVTQSGNVHERVFTSPVNSPETLGFHGKVIHLRIQLGIWCDIVHSIWSILIPAYWFLPISTGAAFLTSPKWIDLPMFCCGQCCRFQVQHGAAQKNPNTLPTCCSMLCLVRENGDLTTFPRLPRRWPGGMGVHYTKMEGIGIVNKDTCRLKSRIIIIIWIRLDK